MSQPNPKPYNDPEALQEAYDRILEFMAQHEPDSVEYAQSLDQLEKIHKLMLDTKSAKLGIKPEAYLAAFVNLAGILAILHNERLHVITSKALSFVTKTKGLG